MMRIRVIGLGEIGARVALTALSAGCEVIGVDSDPGRLAEIDRDFLIRDFRTRLRLVTALEKEPCDASLICVPTWSLDKGLKMDAVVSVSEKLAAIASAGELVSIESTVPIRAAAQIVRPIFEGNHRKVGLDLFVVSSPSRVDVSIGWDQRQISKLVGGVTPACTKQGVEIYQALGIPVVPVGSAEIAEAAKLLENAFRLVNVSFVNEFYELLDTLGVDANAAIQAAASKPFGFLPFQPSAGAGGHCVPSAGRALELTARAIGVETPTITAANRSNFTSPARALRLLRKLGLAPAGGSVLVMGASYKSFASSIVESAGVRLANYAAAQGYTVTLTDPTKVEADLLARGVKYVPPEDVHGRFTAVCITAWHDEFSQLADTIAETIVLDYAGSSADRSKLRRLIAMR